MHRSIIHTLSTAALLGVFAAFIVGIPVVRYACPLMSDDQPVCPMSIHHQGPGTAFVPPAPACCAHSIVAERNTTPFVSGASEHGSPDFTALVYVIPAIDVSSPTVSASAFPNAPARGSTSDPPLFLLHSSLLI